MARETSIRKIDNLKNSTVIYYFHLQLFHNSKMQKNSLFIPNIRDPFYLLCAWQLDCQISKFSMKGQFCYNNAKAFGCARPLIAYSMVVLDRCGPVYIKAEWQFSALCLTAFPAL